MSMIRAIKSYKNIIIAAFAFVAIALWQYIDVIDGTQATGHMYLRKIYMLISIACVILAVISTGLLTKKQIDKKKLKKGIGLEYIFGIVAVFLGFIYMAVLPVLSAPDEVRHFISAYRISNIIMGQRDMTDDGHVIIRGCDYYLEDMEGTPISLEDWENKNYDPSIEDKLANKKYLGFPLYEDTYEYIYEWDNIYKDKEMPEYAISFTPCNSTSPLAYMPQALGISLARLTNLKPVELATVGRLANLIFYVGIIMLAIHVIPFGKSILFGVSVLPMSLHLAASMSYDAEIIALSMLFIAVVLYIAYKAEKVGLRHIIALAVIMVALAPCKIVYGGLAGLMFLIPRKKYKNVFCMIAAILAVVAAAGASIYLVNVNAMHAYASAGSDYVIYSGESGYTLYELIHRRVFTLKILYQTLIYNAQVIHTSMIGSHLTALDPVIGTPYLLVVLYTAGLIILGMKKPNERLNISLAGRAWIAFVCLAIVGGICIAMLIAWTPRYSTSIEGIHGRYFLPVLPLAIMLFENKYVSCNSNFDRAILNMFICFNLYTLIRMYAVVCLRLPA